MPTAFDAYNDATDAILGKLKTVWDASTPALNNSVLPLLIYEFNEPDLKPHPRDTGKPWARVVVRHGDTAKATLANADKVARYRRFGLVWVQVYVPATYGSAWTLAQQLASVAQQAYEGKRANVPGVVFTKVSVGDNPRESGWVRKDVKVSFYWDEVR